MATTLTIAVRTDVGRVRRRNEDSYAICDIASGATCDEAGKARLEVGPRGALLAVSDGMGGHKAGNIASAMTVESIRRSLIGHASAPDTDTRLVRAAEEANAKIYEAGRRPSLANMGATMTAMLIEGGQACVAQVGDSRAYLIRGGVIRPLTRDQSFTELALREGVMTEEDVANSPLRNVLLQAMGQTPDLSVAVGMLSLRSRDCLLLCSDGLTGKLTDDEIRDAILSATSLEEACAYLVERANARGGEDNVTALLAGVGGDVPALSADDRFSGTYRVLHSFEPSRISSA